MIIKRIETVTHDILGLTDKQLEAILYGLGDIENAKYMDEAHEIKAMINKHLTFHNGRPVKAPFTATTHGKTANQVDPTIL